MRNLKRVLSLALAVVMVIGMMVMTTGAADFSDAADIEYTEAVGLANALGIIEGYNGIFNPDGVLYRDQGAKFIAYLKLGEEKAEMLEGTGQFTDVTWAAKYVEYCYNVGICTGYTETLFGAADPLSAWAFGKWLLVAMGNDADECGYNGPNYMLEIKSDMKEKNLALPGLDLDATLTREQAAQMLLIALKTPIGASKGWYYDSNDALETKLGYFDSFAECFAAAKNVLGDAVDPTLVKEDTTSNTLLNNLYEVTALPGDTDKFGRPGYGYEKSVDGEKVIDLFYVDAPVATFTSDLTDDDGIKAVKEALKDYKLLVGGEAVKVTDVNDGDDAVAVAINVVVDGRDVDGFEVAVDESAVETIASATGDNTVVEIYATNKVITDIIVIQTYADTVTVNEPADEEDDRTISVTGAAEYKTEDFAAGDVVLYTVAYNVDLETPAYEIDTIVEADSFVGTLTGYTKDYKFTINGDVYEVSSDIALTDNEEVAGFIGVEKVYHLDANDDIIAVTAPEGEEEEAPVITDYAIVLGVNGVVKHKVTEAVWPATEASATVTLTAKVQVLLDDGTVEIWDVPVVKADKAIVVGEVDDDENGEEDDIAKNDYYFCPVGKTPVKITLTEIDLGSDTLNDDIDAANGDDSDALEALLTDATSGEVFTYADKALVAAVAAAPADDEKAAVIAGTLDDMSATGYLVDGIILNDKTVFILKDTNEETDEESIVVKTGLAALESTLSFTGNVVAAYTPAFDKDGDLDADACTRVATLVFAPDVEFEATPADEATTSDDYIFVDDNYAVSKDGEDIIHTYSVIYADGTTGTIAINDEDDGDGLVAGIYMLMTDGSIDVETDVVVSATLKVKTVSGTTVILTDGADEPTLYPVVTTDDTVVIGGELKVGAEAYVFIEDNTIVLAFIAE